MHGFIQAITAKGAIWLSSVASNRMRKLGAWVGSDLYLVVITFPAPLEGVMDPGLEKLARYRRSSTGKKGPNAARDFHRFVDRELKALPVQLSTVATPIRARKRAKADGKKRFHLLIVDHPVMHLSSWAKCLLTNYPKFMLGGHDLHDIDAYTAMFQEFWCNFRSYDPSHVIYQAKSPEQRKFCIPCAYHGDEGRGAAKDPLLVTAFQVVIPYTGPDCLNSAQQLGS